MTMDATSRRTAFQEGADARAHGKTLADNPHCLRTDEHVEWAAGWQATFDLDEDDDPASDREHAEDDEPTREPGDPIKPR